MSVHITGATSIYVHIGSPIRHARAPEMFNRELARRGRDAALVPLEVPPEGLTSAVDTLAAAGNVGGLLVTMPHKAAILDRCASVGPEARFVGAANAVRLDGGRSASCEMFDGLGLVAALDTAQVDLDAADVLLVGCGGAGSAIAAALASLPIASLTLHNRTQTTAQDLAERLRARHPDVRVGDGSPSAAGFRVVINATRLGMAPDDPLPIDLSGASACTVVDIVTGPHRSPLLVVADTQGLRTVDGADMLRGQMMAIIDYWTSG